MTGSRRFFPVFLDLEDRPCVVIGGGEVAARKAQSLLEAGARVTVIAPEFSKELRAREGESLRLVARGYRRGDLAGSALAFAATDDRDTNAAVFAEAMELGLLVNVVDDPPHCSFIVPSQVRRGPISVAISTQGASPALARHLRERLEAAIPPVYGELADLLGGLREEAKAAHAAPEQRARRWEAVLESEVLGLLEQGRRAEAEAEARRVLGLPGKGSRE